MAAKKISHHFVPHHHPSKKHEGKFIQHRAHLIGVWALFSYVLAFSLFTAGLFIIRVSAPAILGIASFSADQIIALTNEKRSQNGLGGVSYNSQLAAAAKAKAADMFASNYWAHNSPSGKTPWSFISSAGYHYVYAGENLARDFNDAGAVVNAWMNSPSHKGNLLDRNFKEIGVAVENGRLDGREGILVVQMFGSAISQAKAPPLAQASPVPTASPQAVAQAPIKSGQVTPKAEPKPVVTSLPSVQPTPTPQGSPSPSPLAEPVVVAAAPDVLVNESPATVLASRQFSVAKMASLIFVGFIFSLFVLEVLVVSRRSHLKLKSGTLAHLGLLAFVLFVIWYAVQGAIA